MHSWTCTGSTGYGWRWASSVRKPKRQPLNLGLDRDDGLCGGARVCAREQETCIVGNTSGVLSVEGSSTLVPPT